jgi:hypothetical protein
MHEPDNALKPTNVVVIRFSVRKKDFERKFLPNKRGRDSWFKFRARLFEASIEPALSAQSVKPAAVFLYFDVEDVGLVSQSFSRMSFIPIYAFDTHEQLMGKHVLDLGLEEHVVISRIDSDDVVERNYLLKINSLLSMRHQLGQLAEEVNVVSRSGFRTNFRKTQRVTHVSPPFVSRYFRRYAGQGAYFDHTRISEQMTPRILDDSAEWLQIIHGTNVANKFKPASRGSRVDPAEVDESWFGPTEDFDRDWFTSWSGINPIPAEWFDAESLPLEGFRAKARHTVRRWLGQA